MTTSGGTPNRAKLEYFGGDIPWFKSGDLNDGSVVSCTESITVLGLNNSSAKIFPEGTILIAMYGATVGKLGILGVRGATNQAVCGITPSEVLDSKFLFFFLLSQRAKLIEKSIGGAQPNISQAIVRDLLVPIPPLPEQRRIVDLLTRAEGIVRLRREAAAKAAELIPALFIHHFGDPATNPMGWPQCTLGDVVNIASGGTPSKARPDFWEGDLPWVSPKDMKRTVIVDAIDHISPKVVEETNLKLVPKDSVLIVVRGMILAHTVPIAITARPVTINQDMKALTAKEGVMPAFLLWHLKVMHHELLGATSTAAHGTKKLETKDLLRQPVVVPPLALQGQFCEQMMAMESIQRQQIDALAKAQATFDALLAQAFAPT